MTDAAIADVKTSRKFPMVSLLACVACMIAPLALFHPPVTEYIDRMEYRTADWRTALLADPVPDTHERIVIVVFDPKTFGGAHVAPIPRDLHAQVIRAVDAMGPSAIGLDFYFVSGQAPEKDRVFVETLRNAKSPIVLGAIDQHTQEFSERQQAYQQQFLAEVGREAGYLALKYDPGQVVRRTSPPLEESTYKESFARQVALATGAKLKGPGTSSASTRVAWVVGPQGNTQPFLTISANDLLPGGDPVRLQELRQRIKGNVVLTGYAMPNSDLHDTALSVRTKEKMLGVLIHAHIIAQLLDGRYFFELEARQKTIFLLVVTLIGFILGWAVRGKPAALLNLTVATAILVAIDAACYYFLRVVLPFTMALYMWFIGVVAGQHLHALATWAGSRFRAKPAPAVGGSHSPQ
ncbi:MAG: CHASE2 domain-containing protein [Hyphomicrobium sp.]